MKLNRTWIGVVIVSLVVVVFGTATWAMAEEEPVTVIGVVEMIKRKIYLTTDKGKYMVVGQDLKQLVGKKVKATGKVTENYRGKSLMVTVLEIVRN